MTADVIVYASWLSPDQSMRMGILSQDFIRGREFFAFEFESAFLKQKQKPRLDPAMPLVMGKSFPQGKPIFGIFSDASPDRWGRRLMLRREKSLARAEGRAEKTLTELDYLLGVDDSSRMGALRFKKDADGPFLNDDRVNPVPPLTDLRKLQHAVTVLESDDSAAVDAAVAILIRPGGSLGGARPKANVQDPAGALWIAKFPSAQDDYDVGAWEAVTASIAQSAGLSVSETKAIKLGTGHHTFVAKRFDRSHDGRRHLYASAMTLLGKVDGDSDAVSYLDLAEFIVSQGAHPHAQLRELWTRLVFSILVANTDDHLRNHGFMYDFSANGWTLSPMFDVNPTLAAKGLTLSIDEHDHSLSLELARSVAPYFQLDIHEANEIINHLLAVRKSWRMHAKKCGIKPSEIDLFSSVFDTVR